MPEIYLSSYQKLKGRIVDSKFVLIPEQTMSRKIRTIEYTGFGTKQS